MISYNLMEHDMRVVLFVLIGLIGLAAIPLRAEAFPTASGWTEASTSPNYVEIAQGCGAGFHWVGKHRNRYGAWVPGHCARN
jgi:hypothetical protein